MHLDAGRVQRYRLNSYAYDLLPLKLFKHTIKYAAFAPAIHTRVDGMPVSESLGQPAPLTALLRDIKDGIQDSAITYADITSLQWQAAFYLLKLLFIKFHARSLTTIPTKVN